MDENNKFKYLPLFLLCAVTAGTVFCNFHAFTTPEINSKWYWIDIAIPICVLISAFHIKRSVAKPGLPVYILLLLFAYCFFRTLTSPFVSSFCSATILLILIIWLGTRLAQAESFKYLSEAVTATAFILAVYGIIQYIGGLRAYELLKVRGNFDNPAGFASMLAFSTPFVLYWTSKGRRIIRYAAWGMYAIIFSAIIMSGSRTGIIVAIIVTVLYFAHRCNAYIKSLSVWKKVLLPIIITAAFAGLYLIKKDSADGRLLIWKCTLEMIKDKPLTGHGYNSFRAKYMLYQARYFEQNPDSKYAMLADNVQHPFNEFLLLSAEFGLIALLLFVLLTISITVKYLKNKSDESYILMLVLSGIAVFSFFSYPFKYPFTWLISGLSAGYLYGRQTQKVLHHKRNRISIQAAIAASLSIPMLIFNGRTMYYDNKWHKIDLMESSYDANQAADGYIALSPHFLNNPYFLYNYSARLNYIGKFEESITILRKCEGLMNDYDVQMLIADDQKKLGNLTEAKHSYLLASNMCPSKFMPLYELVKIYEQLGETKLAMQVADKIIDKPVKINSGAIEAIKNRMKKIVDAASQID